MACLRRTSLLCLAAALVACSAAPRPALEPAGEKPAVVVPQTLPRAAGFRATQLALDLDGDGRDDAVTVIVLQGATISPQVIVANPWSGTPLTGRDTIGIVCRCGSSTYLLHDADFFATPLWHAAMNEELSRPVRRPAANAARQRDPLYRVAPDARGDMLGIATEAGIEIGLYFDGAAFRIAWPDEEP